MKYFYFYFLCPEPLSLSPALTLSPSLLMMFILSLSLLSSDSLSPHSMQLRRIVHCRWPSRTSHDRFDFFDCARTLREVCASTRGHQYIIFQSNTSEASELFQPLSEKIFLSSEHSHMDILDILYLSLTLEILKIINTRASESSPVNEFALCLISKRLIDHRRHEINSGFH